MFWFIIGWIGIGLIGYFFGWWGKGGIILPHRPHFHRHERGETLRDYVAWKQHNNHQIDRWG